MSFRIDMLHHITSTCVALAASTIVVLNAQGAPIANAGASNAVTGLFRRDEFTQLSGTTREGVRAAAHASRDPI